MTSTRQWRPAQLFAYPFRIFFFSLALWALLLVPLWLAALLVPLQLPMAQTPLHWHQYEMVFGLLNAAIAGFLLTAVGNWTQTTALSGTPLFLLWLVWLAGRLAMLAGGSLPGWLVMLPDLLFLPLLMADAGWRIIGAKQWRQLPVLGVLFALWLSQWGLLLMPSALRAGAALLLALALMGVIGGRITPAFSANWLRAQGRPPVPALPLLPPTWLDTAVLIAVVALIPALLLQPNGALVPLALLAAVLSLLRLGSWRGWRVAGEPLLWVLHLSLLWIPVALLLLAGGVQGWWAPAVWLHAAGIGAMASLILGVMSRVALGHTGRPLQLPGGMVVAFAALQLAAVLRVVTALGAIDWQAGVLVSAALWVAAFALFLWRYTGMLGSPRPDGRPG